MFTKHVLQLTIKPSFIKPDIGLIYARFVSTQGLHTLMKSDSNRMGEISITDINVIEQLTR